jgi:hypothetical protein
MQTPLNQKTPGILVIDLPIEAAGALPALASAQSPKARFFGRNKP